MLNPRIATTTTKALHVDAGPVAPLADDQSRYAYVGDGRFVPANDAAWREVERWNAYADVWNVRTGARSLP